MKDENIQDDDDSVTLKCAQSVSSDLNDENERFSWKGSFESALAASKRQSVGSTDSISSSDFQTQDR